MKPLCLTALAIAVVALSALAGCGKDEPDLVNGKALYVQKCGSCHVLERAGTQGKTGPNLDEAFEAARADGLGERTVAGVVEDQILHPRRNSQMPAGLVKGKDARDVAAYVAEVAAQEGEDRGALATAGLADARDGRQIFTAAGCGGCHTFGPAGTNASIGPSLDELAQAAARRQPGTSAEHYTEQAILEPDRFITPGFSAGVMPTNYEQQLKPEQVRALVDFLLQR